MEHPHYFRQLDIRIPAVYELVEKIKFHEFVKAA